MSFMSGVGERKTAGFFGRLFFREIDGLAFNVYRLFLVPLLKLLDPHFSELDPACVAFGAIGLNGEVA